MPLRRKPQVGGVVMNMSWPGQRQQDIDIKQRYRHASDRRPGIQEITSTRPIFNVERSQNVLGSKRRF
jgi:hypothetical protein